MVAFHFCMLMFEKSKQPGGTISATRPGKLSPICLKMVEAASKARPARDAYIRAVKVENQRST
jgi:hypothetical protein